MRHHFCFALLVACLSAAPPLAAQQRCSVVVNTPEDDLMLAVNGAENPQDQIAALEKFAQEHSDSKFMPCVNAYFTAAYLKLNDFVNAIEYGEKDVAANFLDVTLVTNLLKAYVSSGKVSDAAFDALTKAAEQIRQDTTPTRPANASDADWQKIQEEAAGQAKEQHAFMDYAFFQLLPRVTDANKRLEYLDAYTKAYPDSVVGGQINFQYFIAYKLAGNGPKAEEYGEKAIAADPDNVATLNLVADDYASRQTNLDKAEAYAKKVLQLAPSMQKPEGTPDDQFKANQKSQLGLAHNTLGYVAMLKGAKTRKLGPATQEFKTAVDLLEGNPELQGKALYFLGYAYELQIPANHSGALDVLSRASNLQSGFQGPARELLAKVKHAVGQ